MSNKNNTFLPSGYEVPDKPSNYMKLKEGANAIRILSSAIVGYEWWEDAKDGKRTPKRVRTMQEVPADVLHDRKNGEKHFWAFVVYNVKLKHIQILEITQSTVQHQLEKLANDTEWGDPTGYTIVISKEKTGPRDMDVEYSILPRPKKVVPKEILDAYKERNIKLEALFEGEDPFEQDKEETSTEDDNPTPAGMVDKAKAEPEPADEEINPEDLNF